MKNLYSAHTAARLAKLVEYRASRLCSRCGAAGATRWGYCAPCAQDLHAEFEAANAAIRSAVEAQIVLDDQYEDVRRSSL